MTGYYKLALITFICHKAEGYISELNRLLESDYHGYEPFSITVTESTPYGDGQEYFDILCHAKKLIIE